VPKLLYRLQNEVRAATHNDMGNGSEGAEPNSTHNVMGKELGIVEAVFSALATMNWESFVNNRLPLLKLPSEVLTALENGKIAYTKAQAIARVKDEEQRAELLEQAISENLSLSEIRQQVEQLKAMEQTEQGDEPVEPAQQLKHEFKQLSKEAGRSRAWSNPKKQKKLRKLLDELKALIEE
jgi:ParB family chromosome partitioning protein